MRRHFLVMRNLNLAMVMKSRILILQPQCQNPDSAASVSVPPPDEFQEHYEIMGSKVCEPMSSSTWANQSFMD
ncbi:hypothetical protein LINPERPRIM_LOCUS36869 [Linum perenne]